MDNRFANRVGEVDWYFYAEGFNDPNLPDIPQFPHNVIVNKVWKDDGIGRPASITVYLLRNGEIYDTVVLSAKNNWSYAWDNVDKRYEWSVKEEVPEGYVATYKTNGSGWVTTITNTKILTDELTVEKVWNDGNYAERPESVDVVLLCDGEYFDEVELNNLNDWTYTWKNLDGSGNWRVSEDSVPEGYTPSYDVTDGVVTITNTETLLQTGQLNWPIPVFCGLGVILLGTGILLMRKKKENDHA